MVENGRAAFATLRTGPQQVVLRGGVTTLSGRNHQAGEQRTGSSADIAPAIGGRHEVRGVLKPLRRPGDGESVFIGAIRLAVHVTNDAVDSRRWGGQFGQ